MGFLPPACLSWSVFDPYVAAAHIHVNMLVWKQCWRKISPFKGTNTPLLQAIFEVSLKSCEHANGTTDKWDKLQRSVLPG